MHAEARDPHQYDAQGIQCLDEDECWEFLAHHWLGRVALVRLAVPILFPVTYVVDGRSPLRTWAPGERDHFLRVEPRCVTGRRLRPVRVADGLGADGG